MQERSIIIGHDCGAMCSWCNGSGEGMADGARCVHCRGSGTEFDRGWVEETIDVEWESEDMSDAVCIPKECEYCGFEYIEDVMYELRHEEEE